MKNLEKMKKSMQGITLIALVVTIIVLLILAGIAINLTASNNGLFSRAQNAVNVWDEATKRESNEMENFINLYDETLKNVGLQEIKMIDFIVDGKGYTVKENTTWRQFLNENKETGLHIVMTHLWEGVEGITNGETIWDAGIIGEEWYLVCRSGKLVTPDEIIEADNYSILREVWIDY